MQVIDLPTVKYLSTLIATWHATQYYRYYELWAAMLIHVEIII